MTLTANSSMATSVNVNTTSQPVAQTTIKLTPPAPSPPPTTTTASTQRKTINSLQLAAAAAAVSVSETSKAAFQQPISRSMSTPVASSSLNGFPSQSSEDLTAAAAQTVVFASQPIPVLKSSSQSSVTAVQNTDNTKTMEAAVETASPGSFGNSANSNGGGICSVLLEVIEKLRDAETLTSSSSGVAGQETSSAEQQLRENFSKSKKLKRKLKGEKAGVESDVSSVVSIASLNNKTNGMVKVKKPKVMSAMITANLSMVIESSGNEASRACEDKKLRKKRTSKKLCQLLLEKNELSQQQQQQNQVNQKLQNTTSMEICDGLGSNYEAETTLTANASRASDHSAENECCIETSVVNSLYEDEDALLNKFDSSISLSASRNSIDLNNNKNNNPNSICTYEYNATPPPPMQQHQQIIHHKVVSVCFVCSKCLILFNDLCLLAEHKQSCESVLDLNELEAKSTDESNIYLCDLCAGGGLSSSKKEKEEKSNSNCDTNGIQFKCFNKLDVLIEHYKSEHSQQQSKDCLSTTNSSSVSKFRIYLK